MPDTLFFVHDDPATADQIARPYLDRGWRVEFSPSHADDAVDRIFSTGTLAAVFFLDGTTAGSARSVAHTMLADERGGRPLIVFVNGTSEENATLRAELPAALFVALEELPWVLKHLSFKV